MIGEIHTLVLRMAGGDGPSLAGGHSPCLVQLVTNKWATSEMMFGVGGLFVEETELLALGIVRPSAIAIPVAVLSSTTRSQVNVH